MEEVFDFKCLTAQGQNLEIRIRNDGGEVVTLQSQCDFIGDTETLRIDYLYPHGPQTIVPGDAVAFYCTMDENRFAGFSRVILYDSRGKKHVGVIQKKSVKDEE